MALEDWLLEDVFLYVVDTLKGDKEKKVRMENENQGEWPFS
jgi:hypothetical protein